MLVSPRFPITATLPIHALQKVLSIAQLVLLAPRGGAAAGRPLCVANTHLFFHYMAPHVRTMHTWVIMQVGEALWFHLFLLLTWVRREGEVGHAPPAAGSTASCERCHHPTVRTGHRRAGPTVLLGGILRA